MATDLRAIVKTLTNFYDLAGKTVVAVGTGSGQLIDYVSQASRIIAVDRDAVALARLAMAVANRRIADRFQLFHGDVLTACVAGEVVLFEFCLHEMRKPDEALRCAQQLARDVVVADHAPGSPWSWYAAEDDQVEAAWTAVTRTGVRRWHDCDAFQRFEYFSQLEARMADQGATSLTRIERLRRHEPITIAMPYRLALLDSIH